MDPSSLQNLHDIVLPPAPPLWPPAPGWYAVAIVLAAASVYLTWKGLKRWLDNRYRRQALRALIANADTCNNILKRTALSIFPRQQVAALSGDAWWRFLNDCCDEDVFAPAVIELFDEALYGGKALEQQQLEQLLKASQYWVIKHRTVEAT